MHDAELIGAIVLLAFVITIVLFYFIEQKTNFGCKHKWNSHAKAKRVREYETGNFEYTREVLICEKCGKIKIVDY